MQLEYRFRPANHWNVITKAVYDVLWDHYDPLDNRLKVIIVKEKE